MAQSVIGALRVNLGLDSAQFTRGTRRAEDAMQRMRRQIAIAGAAVAATMGALGAAALRGARDIDETAKAARRLDASTTGFQALQLAAREAGVSLSSLTNDVQTLNRELAAESTGAQRAVRQLGLDFEDFIDLDADERIALIADRVQELGLNAGQASALLRDLGIRNREMVLAVMQGGEAFREARRDVEDYGLAISDRLASRMEAARDQIGRLSIVSQLFGRRLSEQLVPALGRLAERITDSMREGGRLRSVIDSLSIVSGILARAVDLVNDNLNFLIDIFKVLLTMRIAMWIGSLMTGFVALARVIRTAGLASLLFTRITTAKIAAVAMLAAVVARATGQWENFTAWIGRAGDAIMDALPDSLRENIDNLGESFRALGRDIDGVDEQAASGFNAMLRGAQAAEGSIGEVGARARTVTPEIEGMSSAFDLVRDAANQVESSFESAFVNFVTGAQSAREAIGNLLRDLARLAAQSAFRQLFGGSSFFGSLFAGFFDGGGHIPRGQFGIAAERRSEIVNGVLVPGPANVTGGAETARMMGGGAGGNATLHISFDPGLRGEIRGEMQGIAVNVVQTETPRMIGGSFRLMKERGDID